ncbi:MAG TPA: hypothetical protein VKY37_04805 [Brumimicrobium sp.]|nr:hypothetical protein [Brumimicrobium sp.]
MESYYSIVYYKTNALTDELISVGILAGGGQGPYLYFSSSRLDLLKKILHPNTFLSVNRHLKALKEKVDIHRNESAGLLLFDPVFSVDQLEILSKRTKSAIVYSQPTTINEWLDPGFFEKLTQAFFGENIKVNPIKRPVFHLKWKAYYNSNRFNDWIRNIPIAEVLPTSSLSLSIDLLDPKNKEIIKGIDFDLGKTSLNRKLYETELIVNSLPDYAVKIVHPTPKKNSGKTAFKEMQQKFNEMTFQVFKDFKSLN